MAAAVGLSAAIILAATVSTIGVSVVRQQTVHEETTINVIGPTGSRGPMGGRGPTGPNSTIIGMPGETGWTGPSSDQPGWTGPTGPRGYTGPTVGTSLTTGATGPSGLPATGPTGQVGPTGMSGLIITNSTFSYAFMEGGSQYYPTSGSLTGLRIEAAAQSLLFTTIGIPPNPLRTNPITLRLLSPAISCPTGTTMTIGRFSNITYGNNTHFVGSRSQTIPTDFDLGFMTPLTGVFTPFTQSNIVVGQTASISFLIVNPFF